MTDTKPNPEGQTTPAPGPTGSEDEAAAAFAAMGQEPELTKEQPEPPAEKPSDEPAAEPDEDSEQEADEADPDDEPSEEQLVEVDIAGKTYNVSPEVEKAVLRQADYSRKMNEVGAKEKQLQETMKSVQAMQEMADHRAEVLAGVLVLDERIKAFESVDWEKARADNAADASFQLFQFMGLREQRREAKQQLDALPGEAARASEKLLSDKRAQMDKELAKALKGWDDELGTKITQYAYSLGYTPDELRQVSDPKWVIAMNNARKYALLQQDKSALKAKAKDAPKVVRPGAPRRVDARADTMAQLRKDNSLESAEAAFLARLN